MRDHPNDLAGLISGSRQDGMGDILENIPG